MQKIFIRCLILVSIIGISLFADLSHVMAEGHMEGMTDYAATCNEKPAVPQNCFTPGGPLCCCIQDNTDNNEVLLPLRFTPSEDIQLNLSPAALTVVFVPNIPGTPQRTPALEFLPSHPGAEYRCRDGLNSEEPPQV